MTPRGALRVIASGWWFHLRNLSQSSFFIMTSVLQPVIFASIAFFMFHSGKAQVSLTYAALGAGMMGIWSATLFGAGGAISYQRWTGTLEMLVVAPAPMPLVLLGITLATATTGLYSLVATLAWGAVLFGVPLHFASPLLFVVSAAVTVLTLGLMGMVMAASFVMYRNANALSNLLEYPIWLVTGLLVPLALLPGWSHPLAWVLAPTWGIQAVRAASLGGDVGFPLLMSGILGVVYLGVGIVLLRVFERMARASATLGLA